MARVRIIFRHTSPAGRSGCLASSFPFWWHTDNRCQNFFLYSTIMFHYLATPKPVQTLVILPCMSTLDLFSQVSLKFSFSQRHCNCIIGSRQAAPAEKLSCQKPHTCTCISGVWYAHFIGDIAPA